MMGQACRVIPETSTFASDMLAYIDCQADAVGQGGFLALGSPGAPGNTILDAGLILLVAFAGYRMLMGEAPSLRDGVVTFVKIGLALALVTQWPAYQVLVYDVVVGAPAEIVANIGSSADAPSGDSELAYRLNAIDGKLTAIGRDDAATSSVAGQPGQLEGTVPGALTGFEKFALGAARIFLLSGLIGSLALLHLGASILLALGAIFATFLLFDATRALFDGWLRGLLFTIAGGVCASLIAGFELTLIEPWVDALVARREAELSIAGAPAQFLVAVMIFNLALFGLLALVGRVSTRISLNALHAKIGWSRTDGMTSAERHQPRVVDTNVVAAQDRSRAATIADAVARADRRERNSTPPGSGGRHVLYAKAAQGVASAQVSFSPDQAARSTFDRRTTPRMSGAARRRDGIR